MSFKDKPYDQWTKEDIRKSLEDLKARGKVNEDTLKLGPIVGEQFLKLIQECKKQGVPSEVIMGALLTQLAAGILGEDPISILHNGRFERCMERTCELVRVALKTFRQSIQAEMTGGSR